METALPPPPPFVFVHNLENVTSGNISKEWEKWKKSFLIYYEACELSKKEEKVQINIFLHLIGEQCREVYDQFNASFLNITSLIEKFDNFFVQKKNLTVQRHRFFTRNQLEGESIEQYSFELKKLAAACEFKELCDDLIRDRLICGITENALRERLLREPDLTLQKSLDICNVAQLSKMHAGTIKKECVEHHNYSIERSRNIPINLDEDEHRVHWTSTRGQRTSRGRGAFRGRTLYAQPAPSRLSPGTSFRGKPKPVQGSVECTKCGIKHSNMYRCPAFGKKCLKCNKFNHFSRVCYQSVYEIAQDDTPDQDEPASSGDSGDESGSEPESPSEKLIQLPIHKQEWTCNDNTEREGGSRDQDPLALTSSTTQEPDSSKSSQPSLPKILPKIDLPGGAMLYHSGVLAGLDSLVSPGLGNLAMSYPHGFILGLANQGQEGASSSAQHQFITIPLSMAMAAAGNSTSTATNGCPVSASSDDSSELQDLSTGRK